MKVKILKTLFYGHRYEPGDIAELPKEVVSAFGSKYVKEIKTKKSEDKKHAGKSKRSRNLSRKSKQSK